MAQLAQLNETIPFCVNMNILGAANLSAMGIIPEAQIIPAGGRFLSSESMRASARSVQGVVALGVRRKMVETFEVVRGKMGIDDPTAPPRRRRLADLNQGHRARLWGGSVGSGAVLRVIYKGETAYFVVVAS
ncbi:hypothetical protein EDB85DRAFT_2146238 [Lactarius pseudohatsudake]|nr:hypothetical protein EDB85DRAFT_2146238 [Lactarius pseudohatsudake]